MTTRYEPELRDIERRLSTPASASKVQAAEKEHLRVQREREKIRDALTKQLSGDIHCQWMDGEPKQWEVARCLVTMGGKGDVFEVNPYEEVEGKTRLKSEVVRNGYESVVETWAIWKWNTARCAEVDDSDRYIVDVDPPKFVWDEPVVTPKRGRPRKVESVANA